MLPVGQRIDLDPAVVRGCARSAAGRRARRPGSALRPVIQASKPCSAALQRLDLADVAAHVGVAVPEHAVRIDRLDPRRVRLDRADVGQAQAGRPARRGSAASRRTACRCRGRSPAAAARSPATRCSSTAASAPKDETRAMRPANSSRIIAASSVAVSASAQRRASSASARCAPRGLQAHAGAVFQSAGTVDRRSSFRRPPQAARGSCAGTRPSAAGW